MSDDRRAPGDGTPFPGPWGPPVSTGEAPRIVVRPEGLTVRIVPPRPRRVPQRWGRAALLFLLTLFTTTTLGAAWVLAANPMAAGGGVRELALITLPGTIWAVWTTPRLLLLGLGFSVPSLFILACHEMGHYLACRRYRLPATVPYFLPLPLGIGTLGAFIRIKAPIRSKRALFDVGIAGPIAGFVALIPFLVLGVAWSEPVALETLGAEASTYLILPGDSLALHLTTLLVHGPLAAGETLRCHPFVLAAWFGLLATALNLIPLGQLDGGHVLYAAVGRLQRRLAWPCWLGLVGLAFWWPGWLVWCVLTLVMGLHHPPVSDEDAPLDRGRRWLAWGAFLILVLCFMPTPVVEWVVGRGG